MNSRNKLAQFNLAALVLLASVLLVSGAASARDKKLEASDKKAYVVAHLSFTGLSSIDMAIQKQSNGKYFLYVQHSKDQGMSLIDISKPAQPKAVETIPWPDPALSGRMNVTGDLAIISESDISPMRGTTSSDDLVLWDLSNPAAPRVVRKFSGVVRWLQDERDFIYVLNGEGLWVVAKPAGRQPSQSESSNSYGG